MSGENYIEISTIVRKNYVLFNVEYSKGIKRYFSSRVLYAVYDESIGNVDESILNIPAISVLAPVAWAIGADLYVNVLDSDFLKSLEKVRSVMRAWYPKLPFSTEIHTKEVMNKIESSRYGLLFSGGVDSTSSYARHRKERPNLIMIHGSDIPLSEEAFWRKVSEHYRRFAKVEGVEINFIRTNMRQMLNERLLDAEFGRYGWDYSWWGSFSHGIYQLGLCAPLTSAKNIGRLLIASTCTPKFNIPWGSHPLIDENISWAGVEIIHDGFEMSRLEKINQSIKRFIEESGRLPTLRVCHSQFKQFNCNRCMKCYRTILELLLANIDPNGCGFHVTAASLEDLRRKLIDKEIKLDEIELYYFRDIQENIPSKPPAYEEFFEWLRGYDLSRNYHSGRLREISLLALLRIVYRYHTISILAEKLNSLVPH